MRAAVGVHIDAGVAAHIAFVVDHHRCAPDAVLVRAHVAQRPCVRVVVGDVRSSLGVDRQARVAATVRSGLRAPAARAGGVGADGRLARYAVEVSDARHARLELLDVHQVAVVSVVGGEDSLTAKHGHARVSPEVRGDQRRRPHALAGRVGEVAAGPEVLVGLRHDAHEAVAAGFGAVGRSGAAQVDVGIAGLRLRALTSARRVAMTMPAYAERALRAISPSGA